MPGFRVDSGGKEAKVAAVGVPCEKEMKSQKLHEHIEICWCLNEPNLRSLRLSNQKLAGKCILHSVRYGSASLIILP